MDGDGEGSEGELDPDATLNQVHAALHGVSSRIQKDVTRCRKRLAAWKKNASASLSKRCSELLQAFTADLAQLRQKAGREISDVHAACSSDLAAARALAFTAAPEHGTLTRRAKALEDAVTHALRRTTRLLEDERAAAGSQLAALALQDVSAVIAVTPWLPPLVLASFSQYALDSRILAGRPLRASSLGRYNGIGYFVVLGTAVIGTAISLRTELLEPVVKGMAWLLVITTLLSMVDRLVAYQTAPDSP